MTFDLKRMLESKKALRRKLAGRPLAEKLAMLDALRERSRFGRQPDPCVIPPCVRHRKNIGTGKNREKVQIADA